MRILHVANFNLAKYGSDLYSTDRKISHGLIKNDHFVYDFSYRDICRNESFFKTTKFGSRKVNQKLLLACEQIQPDLLLLGHSELISASTLKEIKTRQPNISIALWYVDALFHEFKMGHVLERLPFIDLFFATTGGDYLKKYRGSNNKSAFMPNIADESIDCGKAFQKKNHQYDFIFCGRDSSDPVRQQFMTKLNSEASKFLNCSFRGCLGNPPLLGFSYLDFLANSRMALNMSRRDDITLYSSDRLIQLIGNGLLTFCPQIPNMKKLFPEDCLVYFNDLKDLIIKIKYFHNHQEEGKEIAERGWKQAHTSFDSGRVTRYMLELVFDQPFSSQYEWADEIHDPVYV